MAMAVRLVGVGQGAPGKPGGGGPGAPTAWDQLMESYKVGRIHKSDR